MRCPFCGHTESRVVDSRISKDGESIRRRRECLRCKKRFTTSERGEETLPLIVKKDGRREPFDRQKIFAGLKKACEKRPISVDTLEKIVSRIDQGLVEGGDREVKSSVIGERVMEELYNLDGVAYVRFASVYRQFKDINQFLGELKDLLAEGERKGLSDKPGG
jgi:transcriptional repressor NrdR